MLKQSSPKSPDQPALLGGAQGKENQKTNIKKADGFRVAQPILRGLHGLLENRSLSSNVPCEKGYFGIHSFLLSGANCLLH